MALVFARPGIVFQTLTISGGNVAWDMNAGEGGNLTLTQNATLSNPTNLKTNEFYTLVITNNSTGNYVLSVGSTYERVPAIYKSPNSVTTLVFRYDGTKLRIVSEAPQIRELNFGTRVMGFAGAATNIQYLNVPAARTEYGTFTRNTLDLTYFTECQLVAGTTSVAGASGTKFVAMYSLDNWTTPVYLDGSAASTPTTTEQPQVNVDVASSCVRSNWIAIASGAKTSATSVALFTSGGDGVTDPSFNYSMLRLR